MWIALMIVVFLGAALAYVALTAHKDKPLAFRFFVSQYHKQDNRLGKQTCEIVFTGSSIMRFWDTLEQDLFPKEVINRAIPGTKINEISFYTERLVNQYRPKKVFLYAGSNDIQGRKPRTAEEVLLGFINFVAKIRASNENIEIFYISIVLSPARTRIRNKEEIFKANKIIREYCSSHQGLGYIEMNDKFADETGLPRRELFKDDNIHFNPEAYRIWKEEIVKYL
ncbi:MAG: hypothetical protein A2413_06965 [Treponema sp. RIFOXYC1_FULL_61_9]|nr:MAG: hypothetical protein A2Y36_10880 [Treponema sp. GWA1_62_8]OHE67965.1 MAG: hypothetical protein A2413_06965 [Treponema sp. RIFOXYC1_FULL_61_9]